MVLKKINDILFKVSGIIATALLAGIVLLTFSQVCCRYLIHYSLKWSTEITVYMLMWMIFLSCSMGYRGNKIVALTLVTDKLTPKMQSIVAIIGQLCMIAFFVLTFIGNAEIIQLARTKISSILSIPMRYVYSSWSAAAVIMTLYALEKIWNALKKLTGKPEVTL